MSTLPLPASRPPIGPILVPAEVVPEHAGASAIMSAVAHGGDWVLPRRFRVLAFMGQVDLDLTRVRISPGISEIDCRSVMGQVTIVVPHNLRVECVGDAFMGEFSVKWKAQSAALADAPLVRVTGKAIMGAVYVRVVDPNSDGWLTKFRRKLLASGEGDAY
jgi:hypothetical protein